MGAHSVSCLSAPLPFSRSPPSLGLEKASSARGPVVLEGAGHPSSPPLGSGDRNNTSTAVSLLPQAGGWSSVGSRHRTPANCWQPDPSWVEEDKKQVVRRSSRTWRNRGERAPAEPCLAPLRELESSAQHRCAPGHLSSVVLRPDRLCSRMS